MSKLNPLFVDSTKLSTDSIGCAVELNNLTVKETENVYVKILDQQGNQESSELKQNDANVFEGQIWLHHQQEVTLIFYVMDVEGVKKTSIEYPTKATYVLEYEWQQSVKNQNLLKSALKKQKPSPSEDQILAEFSELSSLIDKWGL